ncbi:MAG: SDR family oxidoreductase [Bacteroidia bacterium]|nr:SDR family oxidoreductase [Bacteroidia bacterium]
MNWAFILGGSSGFGLASARILGAKGYSLFIVHRDRKIKLPAVEQDFEQIRKNNVSVVSININANDKANHDIILDKLKETLGTDGKVKVMLHSIADGNIGSLSAEKAAQADSVFFRNLNEDAFAFTINSMGISFVVWSKLLLENKLFAENARIIGLTSEGAHKVLTNYAAVAASKAVLETACKYMAVEFATYGITTNLINAGITDTPALKVFPNYRDMIENVKKRNPFNRLTQPEDVAKVIYLLTTEEASWINGEIIRVDGGEQIKGF